MEKRYETRFNEDLALESVNGSDQRERVEKARKNFKPMYYIVNQRADGKEPKKLDMSFDCNHCKSLKPYFHFVNTSNRIHALQTNRNFQKTYH
jgi:hypothetical protein